MEKEDYITPAGEWTSPLFDVPNQHEVVAVVCDVEVPKKKKPVQIVQTALYQQMPDGKEIWHCPRPFVLLRWWMRYPKIPTDKIIPMAGRIDGGAA